MDNEANRVMLRDARGTVLFDGSTAQFDAALTATVVAIGTKVPMKETAEDAQVRDRVEAIAGAELRQFIERYEHLDAEKKQIADYQKEVMAEAKGRGYDTKILRKVIALRKRDPDDIAEESAVLEMYKAALGMV
jgi:uncharacterized protein (UPF0335 family)